ncbi:peptidylprolyl isomerase [Salipiger aestuarii]|uniref:Parvulin-like PPIase n=1 Tax=Salipiger aestuarii TaxID=568098 RepID=A0A327YDZ6_9RHOB|nr:peptidyl-prolyl cis-trans isomerase [Salipiger aestuarii]KAB2542400.1 peptidylprolyl isomerase [Salipiger aestuarii]RAK18727.1 peptidyl-prolyl cis-trans isomerase D [Salipiger aestuarii]
MARKSGITKYLVWGVLIASFVGFGAFGTVNFSGTSDRIGMAGNTPISGSDYARALDTELRQLSQQSGQQVTIEQARQMGLTDQVLARVVTNAALDDEAARIGLSAGDAQVARSLREIEAFNGPDGKFNRDAYAYALQNAGLKESAFEDSLRSDAARSILQGAILSGATLPDTYLDTLLGYAGETRSLTYAVIGRDALTTGIPAPAEADLKAWYQDNIDRFTLPETHVITYAWLTPEMIVDSVEVTDAVLRAAYDERSAEFNMPERRLVERLVFGNEAEAQAALDRITAGETDFETVVQERGLDIEDTDLGDQDRTEMGEAADAVFSAEVGDVVGPAPSSFGPALYRVNGVLPAQETSFADARDQLRDSVVMNEARKAIANQTQSLDDELAGGATLEDIAADTDMQLGQIDWTQTSKSGIAQYANFNDAAARAVPGDYPAIERLGDGGLFALRVEDIRAPAPAPFDDVRDEVEQLWESDRATEALVAQAQEKASSIASGTSFEEVGLTAQTDSGLRRDSQIDGLPATIVAALFDMQPGDTRVLPGSNEAVVIRLDGITPVDMQDPQVQMLQGLLRQRAANGVAQDLFTAFNADIQRRAGITVDQAAVNAVLTNIR